MSPNLAVSLRSHSESFSARRRPEGPQKLRSVTGLLLHRIEARNRQLLAPWLFPERLIQGRSAWCPSSQVRDRPTSTVVDRLLFARLNDPHDYNGIVGQAAQPRAQASPDEQQRRCCFFRQCLHATRTHQSLDQVLLQPLPASPVAATRYEARLAGLLPSTFVWLNTPIRTRRRSR